MDEEQISDYRRNDCFGGRAPESLEDPNDECRSKTREGDPTSSGGQEHQAREDEDQPSAEGV